MFQSRYEGNVPVRIGLIGWYGHSNAGDERILECIKRFFGTDEFCVTRDFKDALQRIDELNRCDYILLGGGGLILRGCGRYTCLLQAIRRPLGCIGISIEARHSDNVDFIETMKDKADFIYVRDIESHRLLGNHPGVLVAPDITFLYPYEASEYPKEDRCGLNLREWHYWSAEHGGLFHRILAYIDNQYPSTKWLYPFRTWRPEMAYQILARYFTTIAPVPLFSGDGQTDAAILKDFFATVPTVFSPELYQECRYFIGMRLHSLIFSCQMGIPFVSLSYQPKNVAFCRALGIDGVSVDLYDLSTLKSAIITMKQSSLRIRSTLLDYREESRRKVSETMEAIRHQLKPVSSP